MKKVIKIFMTVIIGILFLAFILAIGMILFLPKSLSELEKENINKISYYDDDVAVSITVGEVQRDGGMMYHTDSSGNLYRENGRSREVLMEDVYTFLKRGDAIYFLKDDGIYSWNDKLGVQKVLNEDVYAFAMGENTNMACTGEYIYTYDNNWNKTGTCNLKEVCGHKVYGDVLYSEGNLVILDDEEGAIFVYSIENNSLSKIDVPMDLKNNHVTEELMIDMVKKEKKIYCMLAMYENSDWYSYHNRIPNPSNGVYCLNLIDRKLEKISDVAGFELLCLENELYVVDSGYLIYYKRVVL